MGPEHGGAVRARRDRGPHCGPRRRLANAAPDLIADRHLRETGAARAREPGERGLLARPRCARQRSIAERRAHARGSARLFAWQGWPFASSLMQEVRQWWPDSADGNSFADWRQSLRGGAASERSTKFGRPLRRAFLHCSNRAERGRRLLRDESLPVAHVLRKLRIQSALAKLGE